MTDTEAVDRFMEAIHEGDDKTALDRASRVTRASLLTVRSELVRLRAERDRINEQVKLDRVRINDEIRGLVAEEDILARMVRLTGEPDPA